MIISISGTQAGRSNEGLTFVAGPVRAPSNGSARLYDFDTQSHKPTVPQTHMIIWFFSETQMIIKPLIGDFHVGLQIHLSPNGQNFAPSKDTIP